MKKLEVMLGVLRVPVDFVMIVGSLVLAYKIRPYTDLIPWIHVEALPEQLPTFEFFLKFALLCGVVLLLLNALMGLYNLKSTFHPLTEFIRIVTSASIWLMGVIAFYVLVLHALPFSRIILFHSWVFIICYVFTGRLLIRGLQRIFLSLGYGRRRVLFIGIDNDIDLVYKNLKDDKKFKIIGGLGERRESRKQYELRVIGCISEFMHFVKTHKIDEVICSEKTLTDDIINDISMYCISEHIGYRCVPDLKHSSFAYMEIDVIGGVPLITHRLTPLSGWGSVIKRSMDALGSLLGLLILLPFFAVIAVMIKLDSKGPIFYISKRVGEGKRSSFPMIKFRSMIHNAEKLRKELEQKNEREGPLFKIKNDPRITRFGAFLRRTSIDELPQLINVLLGHMSLVGPRPHLPEEVAKYKQHHKIVLGIRPGMTGLAQISGRSDLDFENEVRFDSFYIEHWSLLLDTKILMKTIAVMFFGRGAD